MTRLVPLLLAGLALGAPTVAYGLPGDAAPAVERLDNAGFAGAFARYDRLFLAGQPDDAGLARMADAGVVTVINLRTPAEMEALGWDERATVERLGMRYVSVPQGEGHPPRPDDLAAVAAAIEEAGAAPVLVHCASAARVSRMFAAWLVAYRGLTRDEAVATARQVSERAVLVDGYLEPAAD